MKSVHLHTYYDVDNEVVAEHLLYLELQVELRHLRLLGLILEHPLGDVLPGIQGPEKVKLCAYSQEHQQQETYLYSMDMHWER